MPLSRRARWAVRALVLVMVLDVAQVVSDYLEYDLAGRIVRGDAVSDSKVRSLRSADLASIAGDLFDLGAAVLAVMVVRATTERQEARAAARAEGASGAYAPG